MNTKPLKTYAIAYKHSNDGKSWNVTSTNVKASSDSGAIAQIKSKYKYTKDIRIMYVR